MGGTYVPANSCTLQPFVEKNIFLHFSFILLNFNTEDNLVSIPLLQYFLIPTMLSFQDHRDQLHTPCLQRRGRLLRKIQHFHLQHSTHCRAGNQISSEIVSDFDVVIN